MLKPTLISQLTSIVAASLLLALGSCSSPDQVAFEEKLLEDSLNARIADSIVPQHYNQFSEKSGPVGVFQVPEMLTLCIHDSADLKHMASSFARAYRLLQEDLKNLKINPDGAPGSVYYNNDPNNFIFECVYPIGKMPSIQPKNSRVVVLEAANMFIYNYYGPYGNLYSAYEEIRKNLRKNNLQQNGPMREFYITDATIEKDSSRWLTRIMVPVMPKK
jgi:effector-binding domain-containing protein